MNASFRDNTMAAQLNSEKGEADSVAETIKSGESIDLGISSDAPNSAEIIGDVKRSGLAPAKVAKLDHEEVDSDAETIPSGGEDADSDADTIKLESTDDEEFPAGTLRAPKVPGGGVCMGRGTVKCDWLNREEEDNFW